MIRRQKRYSRPFSSLPPRQQLELQNKWEQNAADGNICDDHSHPEPCPECAEEMAAERRYDEMREERR